MNEVLDALFSFFLVALRAVLEHTSSVLELESFSAGDSFAGEGLFIEGKELFITTADLVAFSIDEFVAGVASDSDTNVLSFFGIESEFAVLSTADSGACSVDQRFTNGTSRFANAVAQSLAFGTSVGDALSDSGVKAGVDWAADRSAFVVNDFKT